MCGAYVMTWLDDISVSVVYALTKELTNQFPTKSRMDAIFLKLIIDHNLLMFQIKQNAMNCWIFE